MKKSMSSLNLKKILAKTILFGCVLSFLCPLIGNTVSASLPKDPDKIRSIAENLYSLPQNQEQNKQCETLDPTYKESCIKLNAEFLSEKFASGNKWNSASENEKDLISQEFLSGSSKSTKKLVSDIKRLQARAMEKYYYDDCDKENNFNNIEVEYPVKKSTRLLI